MAHPLAPLFSFSSVAVVGASDSSSYGRGPYRALVDLGFSGRYYPVNPRRAEVHGLRAYPDVASLPESIDAAVVVVGREMVPAAVAACADRGARVAVVISAGFVEADLHGADLQAEVAALARERGLLLVGPNCFGVASVVNRCAGFTGSGLDQARVGNVGVVSNSGGLLNEVISFGNARQIGFSHLASTGNEAGVTGAAVLDFFVEDPQTDVVLAVLETAREPALFVRALERAAAARKPVVVLKLGASEKAAQSALTHTGALAGSDDVYRALFRQKGVIQVNDIDELVEMGALLGNAVEVLRRRPLERVGVIEISGGGKGLVCDTAERAGVELPELSSAAMNRLKPLLPSGLEISNPLDTGLTWTGGEMGKAFPGVLESLAGESSLDVLLARITVPRDGPLGNLGERVTELLAARAAHPDRLFGVLSRTSDRFSDEWAAAVGDARLVFLQGYGRGMQAVGRLAAYSRFLRRRDASCRTIEMPDPVPLVGSDARSVLGEVEAKDVLRAAGLPVIETTLAVSAEDAVQQARHFGYPVALKVVSPEIVHKSDAGGVRLALTDDEAVRDAFAGLEALSGFEGVAVQPMAQPGLELVLGAHRDAQFGPVVLFGLGGIFVETLHDVALRVAPISPLDAQDMLDDIRGRALLAGPRGQPPVDRAALADALQRLGDFMLSHPNVASVDLNPVLGYPRGILGVDARVALERRIREHD